MNAKISYTPEAEAALVALANAELAEVAAYHARSRARIVATEARERMDAARGTPETVAAFYVAKDAYWSARMAWLDASIAYEQARDEVCKHAR